MQARAAFVTAKSAFQKECPPIYKIRHSGEGTNRGGFNFTYAKRSDIVKVVRPFLSKYGLSAGWSVETDPDGKAWRTCTLKHVGGHSETSRFPFEIDNTGKMQGIQKTGSGSEYAARYTFMDVCGLVAEDEDDDGQGTIDSDVTIDENQRRTINDLFLELKLDDAGKAQFLGIFEVKSIAEIKQVMFGPVANALNARIKGAKR